MGASRVVAVVAAVCCVLFLAEALQGASAADSKSLITSLPGYSGRIGFRQWSGYVNVRPSAGRHLFYWFVESQGNPAKDPLVLWLTGGPGCSSVFGLLTENGPFRINPDATTVVQNPYSWNKVASVVYVESPCGVGFSYADDGNYTTGDTDTALDNYNFVLGFMKLFPDFAKNKFFLAGESYAGHYVPQLADLIWKGNSGINFAGFMAGNPSTDFAYDASEYWPFMYSHALVGSQAYDNALKVCNGNFVQPPNQQCTQAISGMRAALSRVNPYNIYATCIGKDSKDGGCLTQQLAAAAYSQGFRHSSVSQQSTESIWMPEGGQTFIPCINVTATENYVRSAAFQQALHVAPQSQKYEWSVCSQHLNYNQYAPTVLPIYRELSQYVRILVYSGDVDSCVPYRSTEGAIDSLKFPLTAPWRAWLVDDQVAGYIEVFRGTYPGPSLSYATIKDAGHMVPTYQPQNALVMFSAFIHGEQFPIRSIN